MIVSICLMTPVTYFTGLGGRKNPLGREGKISVCV